MDVLDLGMMICGHILLLGGCYDAVLVGIRVFEWTLPISLRAVVVLALGNYMNGTLWCLVHWTRPLNPVVDGVILAGTFCACSVVVMLLSMRCDLLLAMVMSMVEGIS